MSQPRLPNDGERLVPDFDREEMVYGEHVVRYRFASAYVSNKRVLDVASGAGYGSQMLKEAGASFVVGLDRSDIAVQYSHHRFNGPGSSFLVGDAGWLPFADHSFDVVVSFETIEHLIDPSLFLAEIRRVLSPEGLLILSTPNKAVYPEGNPFHLKEFHIRELEEELRRLFLNSEILLQDNWISSAVLPAGTAQDDSDIPLSKAKVRKVHGMSPERSLYLVAICSGAQLPEIEPHLVLANISDVREVNEKLRAEDLELIKLKIEHEAAVKEFKNARDQFERYSAEWRPLIEQAQADRILEHEGLEAQKQEHSALIDDLVRREADAATELSRITSSLSWRALRKYRTFFERMVPPDSRRRRVYMKAVGRLRPRSMRASGKSIGSEGASVVELLHPLSFAVHDDPMVSIIIAAKDHVQLTYGCLASIVENTDQLKYEVIVVDDASMDETGMMLERVDGIRVIRNDENKGFLASCNSAAGEATGRYLVFLNNDTEVTNGWLDALVRLAELRPNAGAVGAKLLFSDGRLQEAGGIIWKDGSGWNYGRNDDPGGTEFNFVREVDYCSAACLLVKRDLFEKVGGFDSRYEPAYYEDVDLCFSIRALGFDTLYQPRCTVIHLEGASNGADESSGLKRFQPINRKKFVSKWNVTLEKDQFPGSDYLVRSRDRRPGPRILVVDHIVPAHDKDSGSARIFELIKLLLQLGAVVTFLPDSRYPSEPYTSQLQEMGVEVIYGGKDFGGYLKEVGPYLSACILSRPMVAWKYMHYLRELAPAAVILYDTVDLHFIREGRRAATEGNEGVAKIAGLYRELELALTRTCDASITVTNLEKQILLEQVPSARIHVIPTIHEPVEVRPFRDRTGLLFVGNFQHVPNLDSVFYFMEQIWPLIKSEIPGCNLTIVGSETPAEIRYLGRPDVSVAGWVPDLNPYLDSSKIFVAPLRYGAGLKGKICQALSHGLPVVTTPIGVEGMDGATDHGVLVAQDPLEFAAKVVRAYRDAELWGRLSEQGVEYVKSNYSPAAVGEMVKRMLADLGVLGEASSNEPVGSSASLESNGTGPNASGPVNGFVKRAGTPKVS